MNVEKNKIEQVLQDEATERDAREVAQFFGSAEGQLHVSQLLDEDLAAMVPCFDDVTHSSHARRINKVHNWWRVVAVAAIVLTMGMIAYIIKPETSAEIPMQNICTTRGEQLQVVLQDGTHIYLNACSRLIFPSRFTENNRSISLVGEAYFEVAKDMHRPFVVDVNGVSVEVLGTHFNVKAYENEQLIVSLDEGHIVFRDAMQMIDMTPGDQLYYDRDSQQVHILSNANTQMASGWKEHRLDVMDMSMQELVSMLERRYNVTVDVKDQACYNYSYSLTIDHDDLYAILKRMTYVSPVRYYYDEEEGYVSLTLAK